MSESSFPIAPTPKPSAYDLEVEKLRAEPGGFGEWLKNNPMPDFQKLAEKHGSGGKIPAHIRTKFDAAWHDWQRGYRLRNGTMPAPKRGA